MSIITHGARLLLGSSLRKFPRQIRMIPQYQLPVEQHGIIDEWLKEALEQGYVEPGPAKLYHPIFAVPKASGGWRVVIDLRALNAFQACKKFKLPSIDDVAHIAPSHAWAGKIDLRDFFHHLEYAPSHRQLVGFKWRGRSYRYAVMTFGSSSSPWTAVKVMAPVIKLLRQEGISLLIYMDDMIIFGASKEQAAQRITRVLEVLADYGWQVNTAKSVLQPTQVIEFLGIVLRLDGQHPSIEIPARKNQ
jgi:hypothetical protein